MASSEADESLQLLPQCPRPSPQKAGPSTCTSPAEHRGMYSIIIIQVTMVWEMAPLMHLSRAQQLQIIVPNPNVLTSTVYQRVRLCRTIPPLPTRSGLVLLATRLAAY